MEFTGTLEELLTLLRKNMVSEFSWNGMTITFQQGSALTSAIDIPAPKSDSEPDDLFYSTPFAGEIK